MHFKVGPKYKKVFCKEMFCTHDKTFKVGVEKKTNALKQVTEYHNKQKPLPATHRKEELKEIIEK